MRMYDLILKKREVDVLLNLRLITLLKDIHREYSGLQMSFLMAALF